jgi:hypothetical protein
MFDLRDDWRRFNFEFSSARFGRLRHTARLLNQLESIPLT